jgi:hypothetical protein
MKIKYLIISLLLINSVAQSQSFNLTVNNGYGSGAYNEGDTIHVWANPSFNDTVFTNWTGSGTNYLTFDNEWHTTLIVPSGTNVGSLTINANFDIIPTATQIDSTIYLLYGENSGIPSNVMKETFYAIPPSPKGVVFLFHGTNGSGESFFDKYERFSLVKDLVFNDYAVFTLDANEVTMGDQDGNGSLRWDNSNAGTANASNNIDIKNVEALKDSIINDFSFPANIPCFTLGMSAGAVFSDICASALNFNASAHVTAKGKTETYTRVDIAPVIWIMSDNDHNPSADNAAAYTNYSTMNTVQTAEWHLFKRSPVYSDRFLRSLNNISQTQADSIFQRLQTNGYLDNNSFLTVLDVSLIPTSLLDNLGLTNEQKKDISQQLLCVNADHVLHSDYNKNIIRFFNQTLTPLSINDIKSSKNTIKVYPNPTANKFIIQTKDSYSELRLSIYTINGEIVLNTKNQTEIDMSNLASGTYFVKVAIDGKIETNKIIKIE